MICSACGRENRKGAKFCGACGTTLAMACPACEAPIEGDERFCTECGRSLRQESSASPATVNVAGEKKHITVLFADVAGSMDLQENLDAEVWAGIMGRFVAILAEGVRKYGGTVDKFTGDGIMALFGAPVAQEDHARRACHAAWHLTKTIGEYSEELRREQGVELQVRLGLNSGEVVVGQVGEDVTLDPTALGHTVGLAQRMEALAEPGKAYLTEQTARLVEGWFRLGDLGTRPVKGAREALRLYVLEGPSLSPPVLHGGRALGSAALVGRDRELAVLEDALAMAMEGHAQVVGVVGEAGVGKSRLCDDFVRSANARGITVRRTAGISHGKDVPLLPILSFLRDYFGITDADRPNDARERVAERLLDLDPDLEEALPLIFDFLEVPDQDRPAPQLAPEVRMRRIFETIRRITARRSEREVLLLLFEDLHWFDPQSEAFLERLIESFPGSRTLVITNFRPEFASAWMRHSYYRQLPLAPLQDDAVGELLGGLLGVDLSLAPLLGFVLERTGGNPFFVEEVVRVLVEDGTLAGGPGNYRLTRSLHEVMVPPSVQAVLAARIDRLAGDQKVVLQTAAVIGRTFAEVVLAEATGLDAQRLEDALGALCSAELLQEAGNHPLTQYRFWHPLTQEVTYGTLLAERRAHLHATVAEIIQKFESGRLDELAGMLAWHWDRAGRKLEAARWNMRAGIWALRTDLAEARRRWRAVTDLVAAAGDTPESLELGVRARQRLLQYGARTGIEPGERDRLETEGREQAGRLGNDGLLGTVIVGVGAAHFWAGDTSGGLARYLEAAQLGERSDDPGVQAALFLPPGLAFTYVGPLSEGLAWADRSAGACAEDPDCGVAVLGYSVLARALQVRSRLRTRAGQLGEAESDLRRALAILRPRREPDSLAWTLALFPQIAWLRGDRHPDPAPAEEAMRIGEDTSNVAALVLALEGLALADLMAGRPAEAVAACERALEEARTRRSGLFEEAEVLSHLARAHLDQGDIKAAVQAAYQAVAIAKQQGAPVVECFALLTRAEIQQATGSDKDAVLTDLRAALDLVKQTGALTYEPFIQEEFGRRRGDEAQLREALRLYRHIGATGHARRLEAELSARPVR